MGLVPLVALSMFPGVWALGQTVWGGQHRPKQGVDPGVPAFSWAPSLMGLVMQSVGGCPHSLACE